MQNPVKSKFRNLIIVVVINVIILGYIEFGQNDEERYETAIEAYQEGNYYKTYNLMRRLAKAGNPDAQVKLAGLYLEGKGVDADKAEAVFWYEKAAQLGNEEAIDFMNNNASLFQSAPVE